MRAVICACCCLVLLAFAPYSGAAQGVEKRIADGLAEMRALSATGDLRGVRRAGKKLLASFSDEESMGEVRLLLAAADCRLGFYDEVKSVLAPIIAKGEASAEACEASLLVGEANRSKGFYAEAAANALTALSMKPDESQRARGRGMLAEISELLSQDERMDLKARFASVAGIEIVAGPSSGAKASLDTAAGREMPGEVSRARRAGRMERSQAAVKTFPITVQPAPTRETTLRIGILCPLEGRFAPLGESFVRGASVALKEARLRGIKNIELVVGDTRGDPLICRSVAQRLIEVERVDALMGEVLSSSTIAAAQVAEILKTVLVSPVATEEGIDEIGEWVFQTISGSEVEISAVARMVCERLDLHRVAYLAADDPRSRHIERLFAAEVEGLGGELCIAEFYEEGSTDFSESIGRIRSAHPEALFVASDTEDLTLILPQLSFHEFGVQLLGTSAWNSRRLLRMAAKDLEGAIFPADVGAEDGEKRFLAACTAIGERAGEMNQVAIGGYNGTRIMCEALSKSKSGGPALREELARSFEKRRHPLLDLLSGRGIPFYTVRNERLTEFGTLKLPR